MWAVVGIGMLAPPLVHLVFGHSSPWTGRQTEHERRHAQRSGPVRVVATLLWVAWLALALVLTTTGCMGQECQGHGGYYAYMGGNFYCNDGTLDYG